MTGQTPFKWRHFQSDLILLCVRWYLRYPLSYRNLEEMMLERGLQVDHTTIYVRRLGVSEISPEGRLRLRADDLKDSQPTWSRKAKGTTACWESG